MPAAHMGLLMFNDLRLNRRSRWFCPATQLAVGILICVIIPFIVQSRGLPQGLMEPEAQHTALAALAAILGGFWLHRNVGQLPGTRESSGIVAGYSLSFGAVLTLILLVRWPYARGILVLSYVLAVAWFTLVYLLMQRHVRLSLGLVGGGCVHLFEGMPGLDTQRMELNRWPERVDAVAADFREDHSDDWQARLSDYVLAGIPVYHAKDLYESLTGRAEIEHLSENTFGALGPQSSLLFAKKQLDRLLAVPALIVVLPILIITALVIKLDSPGPVLFRQLRVGYRGREFTVFKFRTMRDDPLASGKGRKAEDGVDRFVTRPRDPRITRIGAFLRRSRIDELPQIINILMGDMSWIGPRPEAAALSDYYGEQIAFYRYRYVVRPGITGWAQISQGHVTDVDDIRTKLAFDFYYIRNFSVWLDLLIVAKTIKTMLNGFGHR
ncbi:polyprenyl glycosylphosphotransferase [Novosphingobium sp. FSY-8]|uniref:Polyprenyl glycosylphosphotransferase n=1 Tax=Novosphingobium ovatum TaxID=1908523 RepID=A0ABW9X8U6_9SPHN|nr:sugar transferase [Novosphingobium ovatum]NBC34936.1 polyprenyl glycosylphosphotransferase [Novosphingobium ovatum]